MYLMLKFIIYGQLEPLQASVNIPIIFTDATQLSLHSSCPSYRISNFSQETLGPFSEW